MTVSCRCATRKLRSECFVCVRFRESLVFNNPPGSAPGIVEFSGPLLFLACSLKSA